jgi:phage shock protein PspC (stress-responsive transcriptional regulator)
MTQNTEFPAYVPPPPAPRPPLRRSQSDRVLGGVAAGFARWLGIDPVIVRVVLVVLAVFGGSGLLLYLIGWLFIPEEGAPSSPAEKFIERSREPNSTARTVLIVIGIVVGIILFASLVGALFGGWGGSGSVVLLLAVGALVLYLANRRPTAQLPVGSMAPAMGSTEPAPAQQSGDPGATAVLPEPGTPPVVPAAYAYGGSGAYPGYVAPQPTPIPPPPRPRSYLGLATLSVAVVVTGILVTLQVTGVADIPVVVILATALGILGLGLLLGAFVGRARWLVALAIPLLLVTAPVAMIPADFGQRFDASVGDRSWEPTTIAQVSTPFRLSVGSAELDLTELVIPTGTTSVEVDASVGLGELIVTVPDDVRVLVDAEVGLGNLDVDGLPRQEGDDLSVVAELPDGPTTGPTIELTVRTDVGDLEVSRA